MIFMLFGLCLAVVLATLLWLGFHFGVDKDKTGTVRLLVWTLYFGSVGLLAVGAPYALLDAVGIHDLGMKRSFALGTAVLYAGEATFFVLRTLKRRRARQRRLQSFPGRI